MTVLGTVTKQPAEVEKYAISYKEALAPDETFQISFLEVTALDGSTTGLPAVDGQLIDVTGQRLFLLVSGGTAGGIYKITVRIQTSADRVLEDELKVKVKEF